MPIGLLSDDQFERELNSWGQKTVIEPLGSIEPRKPEHGRNTGDVNVPDALRMIIGEAGVIDGREDALKLARQFGLSESSACAYAKGATSTASYHQPKASILEHINKSRARATKKASKVLNAALGAISQEKLDYTDAKDLSAIAKDMSVVIKNLEPQAASTNESSSTQPQFVIFAPQFRAERDFEVIDVKE